MKGSFMKVPQAGRCSSDAPSQRDASWTRETRQIDAARCRMGMRNIARMNALHADLKIRGDSRLVHDDVDRVELVRRTSRAFGPRLLAYCVMDTHLHVVVEASEPDFRAALDPLFLGYT